MANVYAVKSGNWSDVTVWNTGALPTSADDVYSNTFTVTVDVSATVLSIRNGSASGITGGGTFDLQNNITISATGSLGFIGGVNGVYVLEYSGNGQATASGNVANSSFALSRGIINKGTGTLNIIGNLNGQSLSSTGSNTDSAILVVNNSSGIINITGTITNPGPQTGGSNFGVGVRNASNGTVNVTGSCAVISNLRGPDAAVENASSGVVNITGDCLGAYNYAPGFQSNPVKSSVLNSSTGTIYINGNCYSGQGITGNASSHGCLNNGSGTIYVTGNCFGGSTNPTNGGAGASNAGAGSVVISGNCTGTVATAAQNSGSGTLAIIGTCNASGSASAVSCLSGVINITGACTSSSSGSGATQSGTGAINITGACTSSSSGSGATQSGTGTINITGTCTGGSSTGNAFVNSSTGTINHIGTAQASPTAAAIGAGSASQVTILTGPLLSTDASYTGASSSGVNPCVALRWFPADTALSTFEYRMRGQTLSGSPSARPARQMFLTDAYSAGYPSAANVRSPITYGPGNIYTGTLAVPPAGSVALGVPVDATTGTATLTAANIRDAVGLASANLDTQLSGLSSGQSTILSNLSTLLTNVAAIPSAVWSAATRTLTAAIDQSAAIASAVWSNSSRTVTGGTIDSVANLDAPTEAEIADAVRIELTPELDRVIHTATTQEVADIVESALQAPQ